MNDQAQVKLVMDRLCAHLQADEKLIKQFREFRLEFMTRNPEHMAFFGGNLTGAHVVRFLTKDRDKFFSDICQVDEYELEDELLKTPEILAHRHVSSDALNHMGFYLIHLFASSKLPEKHKQAGMKETALILFYRFLTSVLFRFYKYPIDTGLAEAVYGQLSNKFSIKQYGSWQAALEVRAEKLVAETSTHYWTIQRYDNDKDIVKMINDTQGRIKDMIKNIHAVYLQVKNKGIKVRSTSMLLEQDGDYILKDKTQGLNKYMQYLHSITPDKNSLIKKDILDILDRIMPTAPTKIVEQSLIWMSNNYNYSNDRLAQDLIDKTLLHSFAYLDDNRTVYRKSSDLPNLISRLKGIYASARSTDPHLFEIRDLAEKVVKNTGITKNNIVIAAVRTALLLYLVIRAFTMSYYSKAD